MVVWRRCQRKRSIKRKVSPFLYILGTWSLYFKSILKISYQFFSVKLFFLHFTDKIFPQEIVTDVQDSTTTKGKRTLKVFQLSIVSLPVGGLIHGEDQWKTRVSLGVIILIGWRGYNAWLGIAEGAPVLNRRHNTEKMQILWAALG